MIREEKYVMNPLCNKTCSEKECQFVQKSGSAKNFILLQLFSQDHYLVCLEMFAGDFIIATT